MYALLTRNRWLAVMLVMLTLCVVFFAATRGLSDVLGQPESEASASPDDAFARWAAEKPEGDKEAEDGKSPTGRVVEVRIYHDAPREGAEDAPVEEPAPESGQDSDAQADGTAQ